MALLPFIIGPNAIVALIGHIRGPRPVQEPDMAAIRELDVDVVIPAHNERETIALCLASLMQQTIKPSSVTVIDDGSDDDTADVAEAFAAANHFAIQVIRRRHPIGKTPSLKIQSRVLEGDVEFVLDADTVLVSPDLIEKLVAQLYRVPGIASACSPIFPLRDADREAMVELDSIQRFLERRPDVDLVPHRSWLSRILVEISQFYEDAILQYGIMHLTNVPSSLRFRA